MSVTIKVNGTNLSLVHKGSGGIVKSTLPDVCKTPMPGGPVPIPYPVIISTSADLKKGTKTVKVDGGNPAAVKGSELSRCTGDEPGTAGGGVKSGTQMKEATWLSYSFDVMMEGKNACRLSDKLLMNHGNTACLAGILQAVVVALLKEAGEIAALCEIYCHCYRNGGKQACVEEELNVLDEQLNGESPFIAEMPYNMTNSPPTPMPSVNNPKRGSKNWHYENHPHYPKNFKSKTGMVRRPDVVILDDPTGPASGDNLRAVVEMKFPPDRWDTAEMRERDDDYETIIRDNNPDGQYIKIDESKDSCDCDNKREKQKEPVPVPLPKRKWSLDQLPSLEPLGIPVQQPLIPKPGTLEVVGLSLLLVALVADDLLPTGATQADDVLIPGILARLAMAF